MNRLTWGPWGYCLLLGLGVGVSCTVPEYVGTQDVVAAVASSGNEGSGEPSQGDNDDSEPTATASSSPESPDEPLDVVAVCKDNVLSSETDESDVDCGGLCGGCPVGKSCTAPNDCLTLLCGTPQTGGVQRCVEISCTDGALNQDETDKDCGGSCPNKCDLSKKCASNDDCADNLCRDDYCVALHCVNGSKDATSGETDNDCGGQRCRPCSKGEDCLANTDCRSQLCGEDGKCSPPA